MKTRTNQTTRSPKLPRTLIHAGKRLALTTLLCVTALTGTLLAQEARPPEQPMPEAAASPQMPDPNETVTPGPQASQVVDGDIIFTSPGQFTYTRDIRLSDNFGGLRFFGASSLTTRPAGAAIQFFGNNASPFNGQLYLDSGAHPDAALIFRTVGNNCGIFGCPITERMRVTANGNLGIGSTNPVAGRLQVVNSGANAPTIAVVGFSQTDSDGIGVSGQSSSGTGVLGQSTSGIGVDGDSFNVIGVRGNSNNGVGVLGSSNNGLAGRFDGNVHIFGNLAKSSGSFKIDHPLDPANRYLSHSFVESPDMLNIYNGNATTDAKGRAVVTLPAYFTALNSDYRYQLTVIGKFAQAIVAREIKDNRFIIKSNKPRVKISWQVTGVRQDAYANAHRIKIEEEKTGVERGTYLHPEAFGQPATKGVEHARRPEPQQGTGATTKPAVVVATKQ